MRAIIAGLLTGLAFTRPALAADAAKGQAIFEDRCSLCHAPEGGGQGPSLNGVGGRKAGTAAGYPYTEALKRSGLVWTPANLDAFLSGPTKLVPGTAMNVVVADPNERRSLIAYLSRPADTQRK